MDLSTNVRQIAAMALVGLLAVMPAAGAQPVALDEADRKAIDNFVLTPEVLQKTLQVNTRLVQMLKKDPALRRKLTAENRTARSRTVAEALGRLESHPPILGLLRTAELDPRSYVTGQLALLRAVVAADNVKGGLAKPPKDPVPARNVAFVDAHYAAASRGVATIEQIAALLDAERR